MIPRSLAVLSAFAIFTGLQDSAALASFAVAGRILDPDGRPLSGAVVLADNGGSYQVMKEWSETPWRHFVPDPVAAASVGPFTRRPKTPTAGDGRFLVEDVPLPAGAGWIVVVHPDFATARFDAKGGAKDGVLNVGDVRLRPGAAVRATVRAPDGKPAPDAWVVVRSETPSSASRSPSSWAAGDEPGDVRIGRTGADGTCVVSGVTPGPLRVASFTASHVPTVVEAIGAAGTTAEAAIILAPGASLRVDVAYRGTNAPVAGARVTVEVPQAGTSWPGPAPLARAKSDHAGIAALDGLEVLDEYRVTVVPPDFAGDSIHHPGAFHVRVQVKPGGTVRVALTPPRALTVRVVDARTKAPLEGGRVELRPEWKQFDHSGGQAIDLAPVWDAGAKAYVTPHARPGPWIVSAWAPAHLPSDEKNMRVEAGDAPSVAVIELEQASAAATGRVIDTATGKPVPGVSIAAYEWIQPMNEGNRANAVTAADGTFQLVRLIGPSFPLRIEAEAAGYVTKVLTWPERERRPDLGDLALQRAATVRGRVTDKSGRPLARVGVTLESYEFRGRGKGDGRNATTDDDGRFSFAGLVPGGYLLDGQRESSPVRVGEGETVERDLVR